MRLLTPILLIHVRYKTRMHTERGDQSQDTNHRMPNKSIRKIIIKKTIMIITNVLIKEIPILRVKDDTKWPVFLVVYVVLSLIAYR